MVVVVPPLPVLEVELPPVLVLVVLEAGTALEAAGCDWDGPFREPFGADAVEGCWVFRGGDGPFADSPDFGVEVVGVVVVVMLEVTGVVEVGAPADAPADAGLLFEEAAFADAMFEAVPALLALAASGDPAPGGDGPTDA